MEGSSEFFETGHATLRNISKADRFNQWMFDEISQFCKGKILEIGSGIGNISKFFVTGNYDITLSEPEQEYCDFLKDKFMESGFIVPFIRMDITDPVFDEKFNTLFGSFDTVFSLNVVEHIEDDFLAVANCKKLLKPGGRLLILVPAFQYLYNSFDESLGHFRRYTIAPLKKLVESNNLVVEKIRYFNFTGIFGWFVSGTILRKKVVPEGQMKLYNLFVPIFRLIDQFTKQLAGLSLIVAAIKKM